MKLTEIPGAIEDLNNLTKDLAPGTLLDLDSSALRGSNFYKAMQTLEVLDASLASSEGLTSAGMQLLAQIAGASPSLRKIDISYNSLGENGAPVAKALAGSTTLESVDISGNKLRKNGVGVAKALASSTTLKSVDISWNDLGESGAPVAKALAGSTTLKSVKIDRNNLGENGVDVAKIFAGSHSLSNLNVGFSTMPKERVTAIEEIIQDHNSSIAIIGAIGDIHSSGAGLEYGVIGDVIKAVAISTGDYFENIITVT